VLRLPLAALITGLLVLLVAAPAQAQDTRTKLLRECQQGTISGDYSAREIRDALNNIPDDVDQYTDCRDVLTRALLSRAGGDSGSGGDTGGGGGGGGGTGGGEGTAPLTPSTDADRQALQGAAEAGSAPIEVAGRPVAPGEALRNDLPTTLLVMLALLAVAAVAGLGPMIRRAAPGLGAIRRRVLPGRSG
jgi:hypothetical protein